MSKNQNGDFPDIFNHHSINGKLDIDLHGEIPAIPSYSINLWWVNKLTPKIDGMDYTPTCID
jgi:hypothetical protein